VKMRECAAKKLLEFVRPGAEQKGKNTQTF